MTWARSDVVAWGGNVITYAAFTTLAALAIVWFLKRRQKILLIEQIPGPKALPLLGNALEVNVEPRELFKRLTGFCDFGTVVRIWLGLDPYAIVSNAKGAEDATRERQRILSQAAEESHT